MLNSRASSLASTWDPTIIFNLSAQILIFFNLLKNDGFSSIVMILFFKFNNNNNNNNNVF
jgi:hypothetical protein